MDSDYTRADRDWRARFRGATLVVEGEGAAVYAAEAEGAWWLIVAQAVLAELDHEVEPVTIKRFGDRVGVDQAVCELRGVRLRVAADELLLDAIPVIAEQLETLTAACGLPRVKRARRPTGDTARTRCRDRPASSTGGPVVGSC